MVSMYAGSKSLSNNRVMVSACVVSAKAGSLSRSEVKVLQIQFSKTNHAGVPVSGLP